jgi:hypothetical protein
MAHTPHTTTGVVVRDGTSGQVGLQADADAGPRPPANNTGQASKHAQVMLQPACGRSNRMPGPGDDVLRHLDCCLPCRPWAPCHLLLHIAAPTPPAHPSVAPSLPASYRSPSPHPPCTPFCCVLPSFLPSHLAQLQGCSRHGGAAEAQLVKGHHQHLQLLRREAPLVVGDVGVGHSCRQRQGGAGKGRKR